MERREHSGGRLDERLKGTSMTEQIDLNRLRRQVSFDRLFARLFRDEAPPWVLKGGYALELRFKAARATPVSRRVPCATVRFERLCPRENVADRALFASRSF